MGLSKSLESEESSKAGRQLVGPGEKEQRMFSNSDMIYESQNHPFLTKSISVVCFRLIEKGRSN